MSWLPSLGARCAAVLERPAGGGAGGEDEVRPVHSSPGCPVDEDRFGLGPGLGVHEHHAALGGGEARVAPCGEDDDDGPERATEFCQEVLVAPSDRSLAGGSRLPPPTIPGSCLTVQ